MSARAEDAARALSREQPTTADAAVPAPANNGSADAEGVEIPAPEPSGNKNLLVALSDVALSDQKAPHRGAQGTRAAIPRLLCRLHANYLPEVRYQYHTSTGTWYVLVRSRTGTGRSTGTGMGTGTHMPKFT